MPLTLGALVADTRCRRPAADAWRIPLEGHVRRYVDLWVRSLDDDQLRVAYDSIEDVMEVARLLLSDPARTRAAQEQAMSWVSPKGVPDRPDLVPSATRCAGCSQRMYDHCPQHTPPCCPGQCPEQAQEQEKAS
jgi:hypothetical protein